MARLSIPELVGFFVDGLSSRLDVGDHVFLDFFQNMSPMDTVSPAPKALATSATFPLEPMSLELLAAYSVKKTMIIKQHTLETKRKTIGTK